MGKKKEVVDHLPDHLRCARRHGRLWRCRRRVLDGMKLCEIHYLQGLHRQIKGCVHVVLDSVSPENVTDCIQMIDEIRLLPGDHKAKLEIETRQVKRMALHCISGAIKALHELKCTM